MRKLGKKFSFLTKMMFVIGLLFSNLAPLKIVFAYEKSEAVVITMTTDNKLNIRYTEEVTDEYLDLVVDETYTYLDGTTETATNSYENVLVTDLLSETGKTVESLLSSVRFDGNYSAVVKLERKLTEENELVAVNEYVEEKMFEVGITSKVYREGVEVQPVNGVYTVVLGDVVNSQLMSGGLAPTWEYVYNETVYTGVELIDYVFTDQVIAGSHLAGEHTYNNDITISSENFVEDKVYNVNLSLMYGSYADNDSMLNNSAVTNGYEDIIKFAGSSKTGTLYVYPDLSNGTRVITAYDLIKVVSSAISSENISYVVSNGTEELQNKYSEFAATQIELTVTPEEFYADYVVNEDYYVSISCDDVTITYDVLYFADTNGDQTVSLDDVLKLINKVLGIEVADLSKDDVNSDKVLNINDAVYLFEMINSKSMDVTMGSEIGSVGAKLEVVNNDITSGDTFTVNYVVTVNEYSMNGISGIFSYDESALELVSISSNNTWMGNNNEESFLYLGEEYLELGEPTVSEGTTEGDETTSDNNDTTDVVVYPDVDYVVVTATFKAKKAGEHSLEVTDGVFVSGVNTLKANNVPVTTTVVVNASSDNSLSSLVVGDTSIELKDGVLDYELTVSNDVETVDVSALVSNDTAKITSIVAPEALVEGENTITVTVEAENGDVKVYTVKVTREAAVEEEEEETVKVNYNTNNNNNDNNKKDEEVEEPVVEDNNEPVEEEPKDEEKDGNKLSRIIIIILILLVIAGLIYLIFKDDDDDDTKKANKEVEKLKKDDAQIGNTKPNNTSNTKNKNPKKKTNKKERR